VGPAHGGGFEETTVARISKRLERVVGRVAASVAAAGAAGAAANAKSALVRLHRSDEVIADLAARDLPPAAPGRNVRRPIAG
jgi:hypothetical protein